MQKKKTFQLKKMSTNQDKCDLVTDKQRAAGR